MKRSTYSARKFFGFNLCLAVFYLSALLAGVLLLNTISTSFGTEPAEIANIDSVLQRLVDNAHHGAPANNPTSASPKSLAAPTTQLTANVLPPLARFDEQGRVLVHLHLDGNQPMGAMERAMTSMGAKILDKIDSYRHGMIAAYLPVEEIETIAKTAGVSHLTAEHPPKAWAGSVTSQGTTVLRTDQVNKLGYKGDGITVGVLSDSFNKAYLNTQNPPATTAQQDVATGDLPKNVHVLEDFFSAEIPVGDEGRAMCQIVYDEAPHCKLAFATAFASEVEFFYNIIALRTQANCDVIVDDTSYPDEPVFSDGYLAQAVNLVATSNDAPGKKVVYCSAAGNFGDNGYRHPFELIPDSKVRGPGGHGNLKLSEVSESLTAGGWHNWNPNTGPLEASTDITNTTDSSGQYQLFLQWDDPFDLDHGVTSDLNLLVFDQDGNFQPLLSGTADPFSIQEAIQQTGGLAVGLKYQIAVTKSKKADPKATRPPLQHQLAILSFTNGQLIGTHFHAAPLDVPTVYGHATANGAIAVAAYVYDWTDKKPYQPLFAQAIGAGRGGFVTISVVGENFSSPNYFTVTYLGPDNGTLDSLTIDGKKAGLIFDTSADADPQPQIGNTVGIDSSDAKFAPTNFPGLANLVLTFKPGAFKPGDSLSFTVSQNLAKTGNAGNSSDSLKAGTRFTATVKGHVHGIISGDFFSPEGLGTGYNQPDGFGMVDALNSVEAILRSPSASPSTPLSESPSATSPETPDLSAVR